MSKQWILRADASAQNRGAPVGTPAYWKAGTGWVVRREATRFKTPITGLPLSGTWEEDDLDWPVISPRDGVVAQFLADYFANRATRVNYSEFRGGISWDTYVEWVVEAGILFEQRIACASQQQFDEWYGLLECVTDKFARMLLDKHNKPDVNDVAEAFDELILEYSDLSDSKNTKG